LAYKSGTATLEQLELLNTERPGSVEISPAAGVKPEAQSVIASSWPTEGRTNELLPESKELLHEESKKGILAQAKGFLFSGLKSDDVGSQSVLASAIGAKSEEKRASQLRQESTDRSTATVGTMPPSSQPSGPGSLDRLGGSVSKPVEPVSNSVLSYFSRK
jgi:hypothetical protein